MITTRFRSILPALLVVGLSFSFIPCTPQKIGLGTHRGLSVYYYIKGSGEKIEVRDNVPLFSFIADELMYNTLQADVTIINDSLRLDFGGALKCEIASDTAFRKGWKGVVKLFNLTEDTLEIENVVPFGEFREHLYITSTGPWALARAKLFRPGHGPVGVILPDNAWELGYGQVSADGGLSLCGLARRTGVQNAEKRRYKTLVYPGGMVEYVIYVDDFEGEWQNGLKLMFRDRYLYDVEEFDNTLFEREDLSWIRNDYIVGLEFAWNKDFYDWQQQRYHFFSFLEEGMYYFGGYDVFGLWPTWPRLGVDRRNQWDLFSDMPGGLQLLRHFSEEAKEMGTKFFICYNPWDESTRKEDPYQGMARLIEALDADGVVLDCHGWSSEAYQRAADSIKPGVVMYSEGMAVVKDMPGIVAGRVHDAIHMPPPLNLNKLIKPDFAIFRVCQVADGRIRREASIAFFNGYGTELNTFAPGQYENMSDDLLYLGRTTMTLRENTSCFLSSDWTPLVPALLDTIWANRWQHGDKTLFTLFSLVPGGYQGPLIEDTLAKGHHLVSLWHHEELEPGKVGDKAYFPARLEAFNRFDLGTRSEGNVDCIAMLPELLQVTLEDGILKVSADEGDEMRIWAGMPSYQNPLVARYRTGSYELRMLELFGDYEGKVVIQLFGSGELMDERVRILEPGKPRLLAVKRSTSLYSKPPEGMVSVTGGTFRFEAKNTDQFIPYPDPEEEVMEIKTFYLDKYPVTNAQFLEFLEASGYMPGDTVNFLKHWEGGRIPLGMEDHPVVYVSLQDARAFAQWAGKRLPTESEWQYAGQGPDLLKWPWGNEMDSTLCNSSSGATTPVDAFPKGRSPFGAEDMVGNVWQLTSDVYDNGTYYFVIMKGGSHYEPTSSWWYVKGGPRPLDWHQQLLLVSPGFDRNSTVGFRCAADAEK